MHLNTLAGAVALTAATVMAKEMPKDELRGAELYDTGRVHDEIMSKKMEYWQAEEAAGLMDSSTWPRLNYTKCVNGIAEAIPGDPLHTFKCRNFDLYDFINHATLGSPQSDAAGRTGSSTWGWTDPESGREFIANGMFQGTAFLEILPEGRLLHLGFLPAYVTCGPRCLWKEIRSYKNFMVIGSEMEGHGVQIFDMRKLLTIKPADAPVQFDNVVGSGLHGHFAELPIGSSHNVVVSEEGEYGVAVGARPRGSALNGGPIFFSLKDPSKPVKLGENTQDGYVHDAQCLVYRGPDTRYLGHDICYGYNEDTLTIYDVTNKAASKVISRTSYTGYAYSHQGWVLDANNQEFLVLDDEYDEVNKTNSKDGYPVTYIWDIRNLEAPKQTGHYRGTVRTIDHNQYIIGDLNYQSNYGAGIRVYDISSIPSDPTGSSVCEIAYFDVYPEDDDEPGGGHLVFSGTWASYAYFKSGFIFVNTIERGAFLVKMTKREKCKPFSCAADNCLRALRKAERLEQSKEFCGTFTKTYISDVSVVPDYAAKACTTNVIDRVSSACKCLPTA